MAILWQHCCVKNSEANSNLEREEDDKRRVPSVKMKDFVAEDEEKYL